MTNVRRPDEERAPAQIWLPQHYHATISTSRSLAFCASWRIKEADQRVAAITPGGGMAALSERLLPKAWM